MAATVPLLGKNGMAESSSSQIDIKSEDKGCDIESKDEGRPKSPSRTILTATLDKILRNFVFILALIEKAACTIGTLNFIWATVVLLGGFVQSLESIDFWFVSIILAVEGLRILSRNSELAIESVISWRSLSPSLILVIQEFSALACLALSGARIVKQQYGSYDNYLNRNEALNIFYGLSMVESFLTLVGLFRFLLFICLTPQNVFFTLLQKCSGFDSSDQFHPVQRLFYDTYSRCINGSVFDVLKMDFASNAIELLQSREHSDQLMGAQLLCILGTDRFACETLRAMGTMPGVLNMLIEMLNWEKPEEQEIRRVAGEIIYKLVDIRRNRIRVLALPESMESITSLLYDENKIGIHSSKYEVQCKDKYEYKEFTELWLNILKSFANDPDNLKISPKETLVTFARKQDVRDNTHETSGIEADHSDDPRLQSVSINQV